MELVKIMLNSAGCMNKGFILEGFPRSKDDAAGLFMEKVPKANGTEGEMESVVNQKLVPQYAIILEGDDASLQQKAKELPADKLEGTHWNDAGMIRRLKDFRARNPDDGNTRDFLTKLIGHENVLQVDVMLPEKEQLSKMQEIIEQKGKPCCINMITEEDRKFLAQLEKQAAREAKKAAKEAGAADNAEGTHEEGDVPSQA